MNNKKQAKIKTKQLDLAIIKNGVYSNGNYNKKENKTKQDIDDGEWIDADGNNEIDKRHKAILDLARKILELAIGVDERIVVDACPPDRIDVFVFNKDDDISDITNCNCDHCKEKN